MSTFYKKTLQVVLSLSAISEAVIAGILILKPEIEASLFHVAPSEDVFFLAKIIAVFVLFFGGILCISVKLIQQDRALGSQLAQGCGFLWLAMGIVLDLHLGYLQFFWIDSIRGLVIIIFSQLMNRNAIPTQLKEHLPHVST